ncbi:transcriptional regulator [Streptomyces sp. SID10853]|nr:transcriptional regulator [Streptomyces sp. SID10853]
MGFGSLAARKEQVSRWTRPVKPPVPDEHTQLAIAAVLGIPARMVIALGWPHWLLLALRDDSVVWESPWTAQGTIYALDDVGGPVVDRRGFLAATTSTVAAVLAQWAAAHPAPAATTGRRIDMGVPDRLDSRLHDLRHLDDELGADHVYDAARAELQLITRLLRERSYSEETGRRLFASASEAARLAGWCSYDSGDLAASEKYFATSMRAAASSGTKTAGVIAAAFWANARYGSPASPDPRGALDLLDVALAQRAEIPSPRVLTMLYIRTARAHSIAGEPAAAYRAIDTALDAYGSGVPAGEDLPQMYWINTGEILQAAGSSALSLGDPARALRYFTEAATHNDPYDSTKEPRGTAIYLARKAAAYRELGDLDGAVHTAEEAVALMGGVSSARGNSTLGDLRDGLDRHRTVPAVAAFLEATG